jgi:hypothetical protein
MKKNRLWMLTGALLLVSALLVSPLNGLASSIVDGVSISADDPYLSSNIVISAVDNIKHLPSIAYNSKHNEYLVVWHTEWPIQTRDIRAQRVSAQGTLLGSEFVVYSSDTKDSAQPSVAYDPINDRYLVTFIYDASGNGSDWDLYGRLIPWDGPSDGLTAFPIITWPSSQWNPKVVYAGTQQEFLVVWNNTYTGGTPPAYISGKRIRPDGSSFGPGSDMTLSESGVNYINPNLSYNLARNEYLVVWDRVGGSGSSDDIWGVRLRGDAVPLGGGPFMIAGWPDNEMSPAVAACNNADKYLVVWQSDVGTGGTNYDIYGYFVTGDGVPEHVFWIDNTTLPEIQPSVACNNGGNQFLVAYQQRWTNLKYGITARQVFPDWSMKSAFVVVPPGASTDRTYPAVAGGKGNYLVAWEHQRDGTSYQDIYGRLVTPNMFFLPFIRKN